MHQSIRFFLGTTILLILTSCSPSTNTLELTVQPHNATNPFDNVGEVISYRYVVTNPGTRPLKGPVLITDDKMQVTCSNLIDVGNKDQSLDPDESVPCESTYTIIQADLDAGSVDNNSIARVGGVESNRVSNIIKMIQTLETKRFSSGSTIQHIVTPGEWLIQIARCYGADLNELRIANPQIIDPTANLDSMILTIPRIGSVGTIYGPPCIVFHNVQAGDTISSIAQKYNADMAVLQLANGNTPLSTGTTIKVPLGTRPRQATTSAAGKIALVNDILKKSYTGSLTYTSPSSMNVDATFPIELHLTPSLSAGEVNYQIERSGLVTPATELNTSVTGGGQEVKVTSSSKIEMTNRLKAVLYSADQDAFEIQLTDDDDTTVVGSNFSTTRKWRISPRETGPQKIILVIYRLVKFDDVEDWREVEEFEVDIDVGATIGQRLGMLDLKWLAGLLITLLIIPAFWRWYDQRNNKLEQTEKSRKSRIGESLNHKREPLSSNRSSRSQKRTGVTELPGESPGNENVGHIFISYRRSDSADIAGRIYDRLADEFGRNPIFKDVDSIPLGIDFKQYLDTKVSECNVLLAIIGDRWIDARDATGKKRLEDPADFVRVEIESALERGIPVIPLLVRGAQMPVEEDLPLSLRKLVYKNGIQIRPDPDFHRDMDRLISALDSYIA